MYCYFFKQKTAYEMRISDWSSDVCSSDLRTGCPAPEIQKPSHHAPLIHVASRYSSGARQATRLAFDSCFCQERAFAGRKGSSGRRFMFDDSRRGEDRKSVV